MDHKVYAASLTPLPLDPRRAILPLPCAVMIGAMLRHGALVIALLLAAPAAWAGEIVLTSTSPYWDVGVRDEDLSRACSLNDFTPAHPGDLLARFNGPVGPAELDVAKGTGLNLHDPKHRAKGNEDYFFRNVGTTSCEVLVGGRRGSKPAKPGAKGKGG